MTTDRTAAPARNTALAQPSSGQRAANTKQAAPADSFSALLGSVTPRNDDAQAPRKDLPRVNRRDDQPKPKDARQPKPADDAEPTDKADEAASTEEPKEEDRPARLMTPALFALQLASPLPTAPAEATAAATATAPTAPVAETQQAPALQGFNAQLPAAAAPTLPADAQSAADAQQQQPATPAPTAGNGGIPLSLLTGFTPTDAQQAQQAAPQPQSTPATDAPVLPQDASAIALPNPADAQQQQTNANTQDQQTPAQPTPAAQAAKPAEQAPEPVVTTTPVVATTAAQPIMQINTPTGLQRLVPMSRVPETTATMIHIAAERGITHARLNLKPVELGGIEVRLRTTPQGIEAKLIADSPEAAKMLHSAADDLRRDLEARDVNLLSLDVSTQSDQKQNQQAAFGDEFGDAQGFGFAGGRRNGSQGDAGLTETPAVAETTLVLPNGVLVDVLA